MAEVHEPRRPRVVGAPGGATRVRGRAESVLRPSGPPTLPISLRARDDHSERHSRAVIDLALRLGEAMLVTGASVADTTAAVLRVCRAYGLVSIHADITYTSVTLSLHRGVSRDPITVMRIISHFGTDYSRLESLQRLVAEIAQTPGAPGDVVDNLHELERILETPLAYRRGVITVAWALMGVGVAMVLGGGPMMVIIAAATAAAIDRVQRRIAQMRISAFFGQVVGAMVAAGVAVALMYLREHSTHVGFLGQVRPSIVVASSIVVLLAGMSVVTAAQDTLDGFYVTAAARTYEVILMTSGIVAGVTVMLGVGHRLGVPIAIIPGSTPTYGVLVPIVGSALTAGAYAVSAYCGPLTVLVATITGGVSWLLAHLASLLLGASTPVASGLAAFTVGMMAPRLSRAMRMPTIALTTAGIMPMLPGFAVFKAIIQVVENKTGTSAIPTFLEVVLVALALSVGVSLGTLVGRQIMAGEESLTAKVARRTLGNSPQE